MKRKFLSQWLSQGTLPTRLVRSWTGTIPNADCWVPLMNILSWREKSLARADSREVFPKSRNNESRNHKITKSRNHEIKIHSILYPLIHSSFPITFRPIRNFHHWQSNRGEKNLKHGEVDRVLATVGWFPYHLYHLLPINHIAD